MAEDATRQHYLAPPTVAEPRHADNSKISLLRSQMERTTSADIRAEGKELQEAAEQSLNAILDLTLDGKMRWASPTWKQVVGIPFESVKGRPIADLLVGNKQVFDEAIASMRSDNAGSKFIRFSIPLNQDSPSKSSGEIQEVGTPEDRGDEEALESEAVVLSLEAQGIMVYDRSSGEESHTMWMIRPSVLREVTIDLPEILVESLGDGAELLAQHLTHLADMGTTDPAHNPPPMPVLCRICERQITPWWFPKHTELCLQEHQIEAELQLAQEHLSEHRNAIVAVLEALDAQARPKSYGFGDPAPSTPPAVEYKGLPIGPPASPASSSGRSSPASPGSLPRERPSPGLSYSRMRTFAVRRPLTRIVELVLDLCDTALEISQPALKESRQGDDGELRTLSPQSEGRLAQVLQWQSPSTGALEHEAGLAALCDDTARLSKAKVEAVLLFRRVLDYSERIRSEFTVMVQDCIEAALQKAARIAAGEDSSDSSDESVQEFPPTDGTELADELGSSPGSDGEVQQRSVGFPPIEVQEPSPFDGQPAMAAALRALSTRSPSPSSSPTGRMSAAVSTGSNSPRGCPTPKSHSYLGAAITQAAQAAQAAQTAQIAHETQATLSSDMDFGTESDGSVVSSLPYRSRQNRSPGPELMVPRFSSSRDRRRTSLILPRASSSDRHNSSAAPGSAIGMYSGSSFAGSSQSVSPLKIPKPRLPSGAFDLGKSPILSPTLGSSEFASPDLTAQTTLHHRRQSSAASSDIMRSALSPRLTLTNNPQPRAVPPSIKDFDIIKPISKGAFGSVYLAKKKSTGDYYAIKALKKTDMVAKNQVANVKAERAILMWQGESDFVAKLYWSFPSKDYIFLVMEYLNGGDCASLIQSFGALPEEWAKRYMAEVVLGIEHLHSRGIVHRDLKPDNLLIDQKGHLKLTDFGLSRMGLVGRQKLALSNKTIGTAPDPLKHGPFQRSVSIASSRSASATFDAHANVSPGQTPNLTPVGNHDNNVSYFSLNRQSSDPKDLSRQNSVRQSDAGEADQLQAAFRKFSLTDDAWATNKSSPREDLPKDEESLIEGYPLQLSISNLSMLRASTPPQNSAMLPPPMALFDPEDPSRKFVGTPDYLAPETIKGEGQDEMCDWWALGCILFEFLFGYPPFHADTPEQVFENILSHNIQWPEDDDSVSDEAKDLINRLVDLDPSTRLGANADDRYASGSEEIRNHPWFSDIDWATLNETEASFIPAPEHPEDTEYFDARGANSHNFRAEFEDQSTSPPPTLTPGADYDRPYDALSKVRAQTGSLKRGLMPLHIPPHVRDSRNRRQSEPVATDDFGQFSFKNLPVLEKANKDVIQKLRAEAIQAQARGLTSNNFVGGQSPPSLESSPMLGPPMKRAISINKGPNRSVSPSALSHANSSPTRASQPSSPLVQFSAGHHHERRKTSSGTGLYAPALLANQSSGFFDIPRLHAGFKPMSSASSPVRSAKPPMLSSEKLSAIMNPNLSRSRSQTVGSNDSDNPRERMAPYHDKRRSQVLDISPSSSDTDDARQKALLRVQKRRQRSRRLSQISMSDGPVFRPLDVLVCEDHPVSCLVIFKLLEKLRCRTIVVQDGAEALRYAMGAVKFDIIMMEFKLPTLNGADVARMIRETKNANCHTPVVAITGYLKELQAPHHFDALIEKPPTLSKLTEVMSRLCSWRPQAFGGFNPLPVPNLPSGLRKASLPADDSPISATSSYAHPLSSSYNGSSREDSLSSASIWTDADTRGEDLNVGSNKNTHDWRSAFGGLGISEESESGMSRRGTAHLLPNLLSFESAPASLEAEFARKSPTSDAIEAKRKVLASHRAECGESGDDEDEELGRARPRSRSPRSTTTARPSSKLAYEMKRSESQRSSISPNTIPNDRPLSGNMSPFTKDYFAQDPTHRTITPPVILPLRPGNEVREIKMDSTPSPNLPSICEPDPDPTPRPLSSLGSAK